MEIIPKAALDYIKNKNLKVGFSYKDVWNEEHATAFTVAKAMQIDVLSDLHNAVIQAVEKGQSFDTFKKNLKPTLQQKGWWGRKEMADPLAGKMVDAQLDSGRRLKTIYSVNMRSAYQKGQYDRTMESDMHSAAVGVLDSKITRFLLDKGIDLSKNPVIMLESRLVNGKKYTGKHTLMGNAPTKEDWYNLIDWLMDAPIFWDGKGLIYLARISDSRYMKIAVDVSLKTKAHRGLRFALPKIDTMYALDISTESERGFSEFNRIIKMEKIR